MYTGDDKRCAAAMQSRKLYTIGWKYVRYTYTFSIIWERRACSGANKVSIEYVMRQRFCVPLYPHRAYNSRVSLVSIRSRLRLCAQRNVQKRSLIT